MTSQIEELNNKIEQEAEQHSKDIEEHELKITQLTQELKDKQVENKIAGKKGDQLVRKSVFLPVPSFLSSFLPPFLPSFFPPCVPSSLYLLVVIVFYDDHKEEEVISYVITISFQPG